MDELKPVHGRTDMRPLTYLIATILLIAMITLTGLLLHAELNRQAQLAENTSLKDTAPSSEPAKAPFRLRDLSQAKVLH